MDQPLELWQSDKSYFKANLEGEVTFGIYNKAILFFSYDHREYWSRQKFLPLYTGLKMIWKKTKVTTSQLVLTLQKSYIKRMISPSNLIILKLTDEVVSISNPNWSTDFE